MKPTLLIMAAGMGSRFGGLKQIAKLGPNSETLIDYSIFDAIRANFGKVVFVIRKSFADEFHSNVGKKFEDLITVEYAYQELDNIPEGYSVDQNREKPWGTGHAVLVSKEFINEPFVVINGDDFYGSESFQLASDFLQNNASENTFGTVAFQLENTLSENGSVSRGVFCENKAGEMQSVQEVHDISCTKEVYDFKPDSWNGILTGKEPVSMNMWCFSTRIFDELEAQFKDFLKEKSHELKSEFYLPAVVDSMVQSNKVSVPLLKSKSQWLGVTYQEDTPLVEGKLKKLVELGVYPSPLKFQ